MNENLVLARDDSGRFPLIVILGPTATGKTDLSLKLSEKLPAEIISADSMQIYRGMDIGTAKAGQEQRQRVPHHLLDIREPDQEFSVAEFQKMVDKLIPDIVDRGCFPLMVGGTGLYIKAVVEGFLLPEMEKDYELRERLRELADSKGRQAVHDRLKEIDPLLAKKLHPNDLRRVIRGIEIYHQTGHTKTYYKQQQQQRPPRYNILKIGLYRERERLYWRINRRVERMIDAGLVEEVKQLHQENRLGKTSAQALGYKEIIGYLEEEYSREEAVRLIKRNTRHFAKKQLTWFKRDEDIHWFNPGEYNINSLVQRVLKLIMSWSEKL